MTVRNKRKRYASIATLTLIGILVILFLHHLISSISY